jgi:hypothetical protein
MRKVFALAVVAVALNAQDQPPNQAPAPAQAATPAPAPPPAPTAPEYVTGTIDFGYRWVTDIAGSIDTYRSVVNLGSGPKLFGVNLDFYDPTKRWFDKLSVSGVGWGGDPYATARIEAEKDRWYRFTFDYRSMAYFDALPSFANPFAANGIYLDQRAYDTWRRMADFYLELKPGSRFIPYFGYTRSTDYGTGITDFVSTANEYPVRNLVRSHTDLYRGGLRIELNRFHATVEEGASVFKDDQQVTDAQLESGNLNGKPYFGQQLYLSSLLQAYGVRGHQPYTRALVTANPFSWLDIFGQFQYSQGETDVNYYQTNAGNFVTPALLFYTGEIDLVNGLAKQPHTSGSIGFEVRPLKRLRLLGNWSTDRLHTAASNSLDQILSTSSTALNPAVASDSNRLVDNYSQQTFDVLYDLTSKITLRGGERYVYGNTTVRAPFAGGIESATLSRVSGLAGASLRTVKHFSASFDYEAGNANQAYYRTSLQDYWTLKARARYQPFTSLSLSYNFAQLNNSNPIPSIQYNFTSLQNSAAIQWSPQKAKRVSLLGGYTRTAIESKIIYTVPQTFLPAQSLYRENGNQATMQLDIVLPEIAGRSPRLTAGGSLFYGSGSRPTHYYQPLMKLSVPFGKRVDWISQWQYYSFSEPFYVYEYFRTNIVTTGLRLKL